MQTNKTKIFQEFERLKGQFVITDSQSIERLLAIAEDDMDYYYVTFDGRKITFNTCVGSLIPLKGYIREKDYEKLIRSAKLNHYDQPTLFNIKNNEELNLFCENFKIDIQQNITLPNKLLTKLCWDLI